MSLRTYLQVGKVFEYQTRAPRTRCVSKKPAANILLGQSYKMSLGRNFQSFFIQPVTLQTFFQFSQMTNDNFFDLLLFTHYGADVVSVTRRQRVAIAAEGDGKGNLYTIPCGDLLLDLFCH